MKKLLIIILIFCSSKIYSFERVNCKEASNSNYTIEDVEINIQKTSKSCSFQIKSDRRVFNIYSNGKISIEQNGLLKTFYLFPKVSEIFFQIPPSKNFVLFNLTNGSNLILTSKGKLEGIGGVNWQIKDDKIEILNNRKGLLVSDKNYRAADKKIDPESFKVITDSKDNFCEVKNQFLHRVENGVISSKNIKFENYKSKVETRKGLYENLHTFLERVCNKTRNRNLILSTLSN